MYSRNSIFNFLFLLFVFNILKTNEQSIINLSNESRANISATTFVPNEYQNQLNKTWAILVAGSVGFDNYRHQADVLHVYRILNKFSGIPKEKIILMISDDIAYNSLNPSKGTIINEPKGENLYDDISKDYTGSEVNVENFLKVLKGDQKLASEGKKVLNSTSDENVLIYYSDHGSLGFLLFPNNILSATRFNDVLEDLAKNKKFNKMVISLEACYSGSIFDQNLLKPNLSIYAITASNSKEESFAEYYDSKADVFLGDIFTENWINSWISCEKSNKTIEEQYQFAKKKTNESHVSQYGDLELARTTKVNDFLHPFSVSKIDQEKFIDKKFDLTSSETKLVSPNCDVKFSAFNYLAMQNKLTNNHIKLIEKLKKSRRYLKEHIFKLGRKIANLLNLNANDLMDHDDVIRDRKCYEHLVYIYHENCFKLNENTFLSRYLHLFFKACNALVNDSKKSKKIEKLEKTIIKQCKSEKFFIHN